jgi:hypothetical protein
VSAKALAAVAFSTAAAPGKVCAHTNEQLAWPSNDVAGVVQELSCDSSTGCKPDAYVVKDRDPGTNVICDVAPTGTDFNVSARLSIDGTSMSTPSITFEVHGALTPMGGTATLGEQNSVTQSGGNDFACNITIAPNRGFLKAGAILATFRCDGFRNPTDISETGCTFSGAFLFENCAN